MVNVIFSKKYLFSLLGSKLDDKKLESYIAKMGFEMEGASATEVTIELPANRPDLVDIVGFARALKNFLHKGKALKYELKNPLPIFQIKVGKDVKDVRSFISALVVEDIKFSEESLKHLLNFTEKFASNYGRARKKLAIGLHDLDSITPPLAYDAVKDEEFYSLGSKKKIKFSEILKKHEKGIAYAAAIGSSSLYPVVRDFVGTISLVPIINSERTKVTAKTRNLLIELTGTNRYSVEKSADLFAAMFMDMGGKVRKVEIAYKDEKVLLPKMHPEKIEIPLLKIESQIGVIIGFNNVISLANKMGYRAALVGRNIRFWIPEYRLDILNEQDVIEDIAIAYGYDYIQPVPIFSEQIGELESTTKRNMKISEVMVGMGFSEMMNSFLTSDNLNFEKMRLPKDAKGSIRVKAAKVQQLTMLRTSLLPSLLKNLGMSVHEKMPQKIFELDMAFNLGKSVDETQNVAAVLTDPKANFNQIKAIVEGLLQSIGVEYKIKEILHSSFIEGRSASIILNGKGIGVFGEIHPEVLNNFGIEEPTVAFELSL
ncbi:MAG: phenylalanine--tRNA ligase subunit beta [Candidatus Micrarchaeota archaeon]|nr:phenylalanine--tRNA ligase subunit beta [Candidatus Micrarchaeota archaeon]MDE2022016.1 phenylalanine--tRNA ligase subunit beta [Patescibacteria group bacterium]